MPEPVKRGDPTTPLGGTAMFSGRYIYCGHCSPEPLDDITAVRMLVREVDLVLKGDDIHVDVVECPKCGHQIIR